jgi:hypothetical protein
MNLDERSSLLIPENIEECVRRIRKEEGGRNCDELIKTFRDLMTKLDIKMSDNDVEEDKQLESNGVLCCCRFCKFFVTTWFGELLTTIEF